MPVTSSQKKSLESLNEQKQSEVPVWKAVLLDRRRSQNELFPQWKLEMIKRRHENALENNHDSFGKLSQNRKSWHSSVPCLSTFQVDSIYEEIDERIVPISCNPIVLLDQEKRRSLSIQEKDNMMLKKLSHEICRENKLEGDMEYGKGFVGKLLKKFNSLLNLRSSEKSNKKIYEDGSSTSTSKCMTRRDERLDHSSCNHDSNGRAQNRVENIFKQNDSMTPKSMFSLNNTLLGPNSRQAVSVESCQKSSDAVDNRLPNSISSHSAVFVPDFCDDGLYEEISNHKVKIRSLKNSVHQQQEEIEELPRQNQVKETKSVFENFASKSFVDATDIFLSREMKSLNRYGTNSKFYGGVEKSSNEHGDVNSKKNLPDILLSNSLKSDNSMKTPTNEANNPNSNNKAKFSLNKISDTKENFKLLDNDGLKESQNFGSALSSINLSSTSSSASMTKPNRPGTLVVRPSSNIPMQGVRPYKDIRDSPSNDANQIYMSSDMNSIYSSTLLSSSISAKGFSETYGIFGPESFVTSGYDDIPFTNIDSVLEDSEFSKNKLQSNVVTKATIKLNQPSPHERSALSSFQIKSLLLDSPRSDRGLANEEFIEPKEESADTTGGGVAITGGGVIHKKSALVKAKDPKRKMSVTFLDPNPEDQIFEYPPEDASPIAMNDFMKPSINSSSHLSSYRSKMHVDFDFGSSYQKEDYNVTANQNEDYNVMTNQEASKFDVNHEAVDATPSISHTWTSSMSLDLMF